MVGVARFALTGMLLVGCVEHDLVLCTDGRACPVGTTCDVANATCVEEGAVGLAAPEIELTDVTCGTSAMHTIVVSNPGTTEIPITARVTPSDLSIAPAEATIPAGGAVELTLTLDAGAANTPGDVNVGAMTIETPRENLTRVIRYSTSGALVTASASVDLGETPSNGSEIRTFSVKNRGTVPTELTITNLADPFSMPTASPITIAPNTERELVIKFDPEGVVGDYTRTAQLAFSGPHCEPPPTTLALSARASGDAMLAGNTLVEFDAATCGVPAEQYLIKLSSQSSANQSISVSFIGDSQGMIANAPDTLPPSPGMATVMLQRPRLTAPHPLGSFAALLQITAIEDGTGAMVIKQIPVSYRVAAPVLATSPLAINVTGVSDTTFTVVNNGNATGQVRLTDLSREHAEIYGMQIAPDFVDLSPGEGLEVAVQINNPYSSGDLPDEGVTLGYEAVGQCSELTTTTLTAP